MSRQERGGLARGGAGLIAVTLALAACARPSAEPIAATPPPASSDPLEDAAAALAAAEAAGSTAARAPWLRRLDALRVAAAEDTGDDPLSAWRAEAAPGEAPVPTFRGRALGPAYRHATIAPGKRMQIEQIFYAGQRAEIAAQSQDGQPVALAIRDKRQEPVCAASLAPSANCQWMPLFTERFSIELVNNGGKPASVYIVFR